MRKLLPILKKFIPIAVPVCLIGILIYWIAGSDISMDTLLELTPKEPILAALVLLFFYGCKSITVVFPLILLEITSGHLFSPGFALLVNLLGIMLCLTLPYWIGQKAGLKSVEKWMKKSPKFQMIMAWQQYSSFFLCFFLRNINCLPSDVISMYMGATRVAYWKNLLGGTLGLLPGMFLATLVGVSIQDPGSPMFQFSVLLTVTLSALSIVIFYFYQRRQKKRKPLQTKEPVSKTKVP